MLSPRMQELEEVSKELLKVLHSDWTDGQLRRSLERRSRMEDKLLLLQARAAKKLQELQATEERVAQALVEQQGELQRTTQWLQEQDEKIAEVRRQGDDILAAIGRLQRELRELQERNQRLEEILGQEEEAVPSAAYVTQLYYKISRIDWDYEAEPGQIKGIHYGPDVAQPITIDSSRHSRCFISDYLWSLVPTSW